MSNDWLTRLLPWSHFLGKDDLVRLRAGGTMAARAVSGPSAEATSEAELEAQAERIGRRAFGCFGTGDFLHFITHRVEATSYSQRQFPTEAARLIDDERRRQFQSARYYMARPRVYISNQDERAVVNKLKATFFGSTAHRIGESRELQHRRFLQRVQNWENAVGSTLHPKPMGRAAIFRDLMLCLTGRDFPALEPQGHVPLYHALAQQDFIGGSEPEMGDLFLRPISVTSYPAASTPQMLAAVLKDPGRLILSVRFVCLDQVDALTQLQLERQHWVKEAAGGLGDLIAKVLNLPRRETWNQDAEEQIASVDEAIAACKAGMPFGFLNITAIGIDTDAERLYSRCRQIVKDLENPLGLGARIEDANASAAVLGALPGEGTWNRRHPLMPASAVAEMILPVEYWAGTPTIDSKFFPKDTPVPLVVSGSGYSPFSVPTHHNSLGHALLIGGSGDGKSTLLNTQVAATTAIPDVRMIWIDREYSSWVLTHALDGTYIELAGDKSSPLCPLQFLDLPNGETFLFDWFIRLFTHWQLNLDERQAADLLEALRLAKVTGMRTMTAFMHLIQDRRMRAILAHYCGQWAHIFDGEPTFHDNMLVTYEMRELDPLGDQVTIPATELIIAGAERHFGKHPCFVFCDEAWTLLKKKVTRKWLYGSLRTARKLGASIILSTQAAIELVKSGYIELLLQNTPVKIWTPSDELKGEHVRESYRKLGLLPTQLDVLCDAVQQRQYLLTYPGRKCRLFDLDLGPIGRALCGSTGSPQVAAARELMARVGQSEFVNEWLQLCGHEATRWLN
jgi:type IV secretion system protein TrbE